jgi:elongation factor G
MQEIDEGLCGDIVALFGVDCSLGNTFVSGDINYSLKSMHVPPPIISLCITPKDNKSQMNMSKALNRFMKEDPTFKSYVDDETKETIIKGMGELHLDVYIERMRREYKVELDVGKPHVSYRETITSSVTFDYTHRKQSGGRGQYARVCGVIEPSGSDVNVFIDEIKGGVIPGVFIPCCEKGFAATHDKGQLIGSPIVGMKMTLNDGNYHPVDSSALAFELATLMSVRTNYMSAKPRILEPIMRLNLEIPSEYRGVVMGSINQRRGHVVDTVVYEFCTHIEATIPMSEVFGYATVLRSLTQGKSEFVLEFLRYEPVPKTIEEKIIEEMKK